VRVTTTPKLSVVTTLISPVNEDDGFAVRLRLLLVVRTILELVVEAGIVTGFVIGGGGIVGGVVEVDVLGVGGTGMVAGEDVVGMGGSRMITEEDAGVEVEIVD